MSLAWVAEVVMRITPVVAASIVLACGGLGCTVSGGRRVDDGGGGGGDTDAAAARDLGIPPSDATCEALVLRSMPGVSNVLIVLDRSSSMYREPALGMAGVDRWNPAITAVRAAVSALDDRVNFGLMLFADPDAPAGMTLCGAGKVDVAPAVGTFATIDAELTGDPNVLTGSWTPTAVSLDAARTALGALTGRSYVLLITDGAPNCNSALDGAACRCGSTTMSCSSNPRLCIDDDRTVAAVAALRDAGIETFVVGYDTSEWADVLDRMAAAGGTAYTTHIPVGDEASLEAALSDIGGSVISCSVELSAPPDALPFVHVTLDGVDVPNEMVATTDAAWALVGGTSIELRGSACATLRDGGAHELSIRRECHRVF